MAVAKKGGLRPFRELLREYRLSAGLTVTQLAKRSGVLRSTIQLLESGERGEPRRWTMAALAEALQIGPELFFEKTGSRR